jgi:hypothetical protein
LKQVHIRFLVAWGFGDPHYDNMDRMNYTFNGCGKYMFLDTENSAIQIQVKFTQATGAGLGTVISAIIFKVADVSPIQINLMLGGMYRGLLRPDYYDTISLINSYVKVKQNENLFTRVWKDVKDRSLVIAGGRGLKRKRLGKQHFE